jgi:ABC-type transport system involved in multi-copper enzyme maturation permease subunit
MVDVLTDASSTFGEPMSAVGGALVFGGVAVVLMAASYVLFAKRDA